MSTARTRLLVTVLCCTAALWPADPACGVVDAAQAESAAVEFCALVNWPYADLAREVEAYDLSWDHFWKVSFIRTPDPGNDQPLEMLVSAEIQLERETGEVRVALDQTAVTTAERTRSRR